ncbi:MAG TPA: diadenylate cyclase CdaA [Fimbriimonas sp.]
MEDILRQFASLRDLSLREILVHVLDILLVAYLNYRLLMLVRGTRAWRILVGVMIFLIVLLLSRLLGLHTLYYILERATLLAPVALVILLLPELRTALETFGKLGLWPQKLVTSVEDHTEARTVEELVAACAELAAQSVGALIVIEKGTPLDEIAANGVTLDAKVSAPLLNAIFYEGNPLHDGAVIVRNDTIVAAACRLPLSESARLDPNLHMRHRAGVGVTEVFDCIAVIVSEERGTISYAYEGRVWRLANHIELRDRLNRELRSVGAEKRPEKTILTRRQRRRSAAKAKP